MPHTPTRTRIRLKPASCSARLAYTSSQTLPIGQLACVFAHFPPFTSPFACDTEPRVCEILIIDTPVRIVRWTYRSCHISWKLKWMINSCAFVASSATSGSIHLFSVLFFECFPLFCIFACSVLMQNEFVSFLWQFISCKCHRQNLYKAKRYIS